MCNWQVGLERRHYSAYREYSKQQLYAAVVRKVAKEEAAFQSVVFAQWALKNVAKGLSCLVLYEDPLSAELEGQVYQGWVVKFECWPPAVLVKFVLQLQPGDEGDEFCSHSLEFKSRAEFDGIVEIIQ